MNRFWEPVLQRILESVEARLIIEVGAGTGVLTAHLLDWAGGNGAVVHSVDPQPGFDVPIWRRRYGERLVFHRARSLNVLGKLKGVDVALIDGDHNWFTVLGELRLLERSALGADAAPPVVALHDIGWPYGRRDMYYDPSRVPVEHRQPYERKGLLPGESNLVGGGLNDYLLNAIHDQPMRNGVRSAIEDFMEESAVDWRLAEVPGVHGLGILVTSARLESNSRLRAEIKSLSAAAFLRTWCERIELERVRSEVITAKRGRALDEALRHVTQLEERLEALGHSATQLQAELGRTQDDLARTQGELTASKGELAGIGEQLADLAAQLARGRQLHQEAVEDIERLEREADHSASAEAELRRELIEARKSPDGASEGAIFPATDPLEARLQWMDRTIDERDPALNGDRDAYLAISRSALDAVRHALAAAGLNRPETIADLPCGYGRVTRALRAAWPQAELVSADRSTDAVAFCVEQFEAHGWVVDDYLTLGEDPDQRERFDLIWSGSLLTSIDPRYIDGSLTGLLSMLRPGGLLVAAYHGRDSARRLHEHQDERLQAVGRAVDAIGTGFSPRTAGEILGTAAMTPQWLLSQLVRQRDLMVVSLTERGWGDHLDVMAVVRRDIHHQQAVLTQ